MKRIVKKRIEPLPTKAKIGRPGRDFSPNTIRNLMLQGASVSDIQEKTGLGRGTAGRAFTAAKSNMTPHEIEIMQGNRRHRNLRELSVD